MWNADFSQVCTSFTLQRINSLELSMLSALRYDVKVLASEYAKYYFLLRSMLMKSGLGGDHVESLQPLDIQGAKQLEAFSEEVREARERRREATRLRLRSEVLIPGLSTYIVFRACS